MSHELRHLRWFVPYRRSDEPGWPQQHFGAKHQELYKGYRSVAHLGSILCREIVCPDHHCICMCPGDLSVLTGFANAKIINFAFIELDILTGETQSHPM